MKVEGAVLDVRHGRTAGVPGSLGYSTFSQLGVMREGWDVTTTWEGRTMC